MGGGTNVPPPMRVNVKGEPYGFVLREGFEPSRLSVIHFECIASTGFAIGAVARLRYVLFHRLMTNSFRNNFLACKLMSGEN